MANEEWLDLLGWSENELEGIRFVAYSYIRQGHYDIAITLLEALLVVSDNNPYDLETLGAIYLQKGDGVKALNYLEKALKINPTNLVTLLNRAKALFILGYKKQGAKECEKLKATEDKEIIKEAEALLISFA